MTDQFKLELHLFGGISVHHRGIQLDLGKKQRAFLAYLALSPEASATRDRIIGALWSEFPLHKAQANLRQVIYNIRARFQPLGFSGLKTVGRTLFKLEQDSVQVDVWAAMDSVSSGSPVECLVSVKDIPETLMAGFEGLDSEFDGWVYAERRSTRDRLRVGLEVALHALSSNPLGTRRAASALLNLDPSNEVAVRAMMRSHAEDNNVASALQLYDELFRKLDDEYGMPPTDETQRLAVQIKLMEGQQAVVPPSPSLAREATPVVRTPPELVVGAFGSELIPAERVYVVNGFRHDLLASLARFRDWRVVEQASGEPARPLDPAAPERYFLSAKTYEDGPSLHLVFTVKDVGSSNLVWAEKFRLLMESWFTTQQEIIRRLAISLNIHISADRLSHITYKRSLPAALHDRWLLGQDLFFRWRPADSARAVEIYRSIIDDAPDFAPAYSGLVQFENSKHLIYPGLRRKDSEDSSTVALARMAVQTDPADSKAHLCLAWSFALGGRFGQALASFQTAQLLNENDPWTLVSTAQGVAFCADYDWARALVTQANEFGLISNPMHCAYQVGTRFLFEDYEGAVEAAERAGDIISNIAAWKTSALSHLGQTGRARLEGRRFLALIRSNWHGGVAEPRDADILDWLLHCFPIRKRSDWNRLRAGLAHAGLSAP